MKARVGVIVGAIAFAFCADFGNTATANQWQAAEWCSATEAEGVSLDLQISGCTTVIGSRKGSKKSLADPRTVSSILSRSIAMLPIYHPVDFP